MDKKIKHSLKLISLTLAATLSFSSVALAGNTPTLVYDDVTEPTLNHKVIYDGNEIERPKYYDTERNTLYQSSLNVTNSAQDHTFERQHISVNSEGIIPDDQVELLDTSKVYMDYVHHYSVQEDGITKSVPLAVFGDDKLDQSQANYYNTYPAKEPSTDDTEETETEDDEAEEDPEEESSTISDMVTDLLDRHEAVSMNIYPDRTEVQEGGEYTSTDSQVVYKIFRSLDNSKTPLAKFDEDIDIYPENKLNADTLSFTETQHVGAEDVVSANEAGRYTTKLGEVTEESDGTTKYNPAEYWKIATPITSIYDETSVLDYAKYIHDHYPKLKYGSDYFIYQDPGLYDSEYEAAVSKYTEDVEGVQTLIEDHNRFTRMQDSLRDFLVSMNSIDHTAADKLKGYSGDVVTLVNKADSLPLIPKCDMKFEAPSTLGSASVKSGMRHAAINGTNVSLAEPDSCYKWTNKPTVNLTTLSDNLASLETNIPKQKDEYTDILNNCAVLGEKQSELLNFLDTSNVITSLSKEEFDAKELPGHYIKVDTWDYEKALEDLETEINNRNTALDALLESTASMKSSVETLQDIITQGIFNEEASEDNTYFGFGLAEYEVGEEFLSDFNNSAEAAITEYVADINEASADYDELISGADYISEVKYGDLNITVPKGETLYYRLEPQIDTNIALMKYIANEPALGYEGTFAEWLNDYFPDIRLSNEESENFFFNKEYVAENLLYDEAILDVSKVSQWESLYTNIDKFSIRTYAKPEPQAHAYLYIRDSATPSIVYVYDDVLLHSFNAATAVWEDSEYYVVPLGNDSKGFQYTALANNLSLPEDEAKFFGVTFKFNRDTTGINRYYSPTRDGVHTEDATIVKNITNMPNFVPEVNGYIGVSYYGFFDKFYTNLSHLENDGYTSITTYENPVKIGNSIVERVLYERQLNEGESYNPDWDPKTYRCPDLLAAAPHIIWYEIQDTGTINVGFKNFAIVGGTDTLLVNYEDPSRRLSYLGDGKYTRGPDTFTNDFKKVDSSYKMSNKWPTPAAFDYNFSIEDYNSVSSKLKPNMSLGEMLEVANTISGYSSFDDDTKISYVNQMVKYKNNVPDYLEAIATNYKDKQGAIDGAQGITANDYLNMDITDQVIAPYIYENPQQKTVLLKLQDPQLNKHQDLYFMLDTYGTNVVARRYIRLKRDAEVGSSGVKVKDASGNLEESIPWIYTLYLTERTDDKLTHEFTNNILADTGTTSGVQFSAQTSLRTYSITPSVKYIPEVEIDDVNYDYYELTYSVPYYGTWRASEYLDENAQLHLIKDYAHPKEGRTITNTSESAANTYKVTPVTTETANSQVVPLYELGYACLNPMGLDYDPDPSNLDVVVNSKSESVLNKNKGEGLQCGDWAFISTDPYLWTSYSMSDVDTGTTGKSYNNYVNLPGQSDSLAAFDFKSMSSFIAQFDATSYGTEHKITTNQQVEKHPAIRDGSGFYAPYKFMANMTIAVTTAEALSTDLSHEDVYVEFNNDGATHNVESRYALFILQSLGKSYLLDKRDLWTRSAESLSDKELNELLVDVDYELKDDLHEYMELLSTEEKRSLFKVYQLYRQNKYLGRDVIFSDMSVSYKQGVGPSFEVLAKPNQVILSGTEANQPYSLFTFFAQKYLQNKVRVTTDQGYTDRLANNIIFVSNVYPSLTYRVANIQISLSSRGNSQLYNSVESGENGKIYTFADSKLVKDNKTQYVPNLVVWYAKVSPLLPAVSVETPVSSQPIQPIMIETDDTFVSEVAVNYSWIVGVRITAPGTYRVYDADVGGDIVFTVTSSGMIFNTFYGPFDPNNPETYLNLAGGEGESPTVRIDQNTYNTEFTTKTLSFNGISIPSDRYIYYMIANVSPAEAEKISAQISLTYDNKTSATVDMKAYTVGNENGIYIFYHKVECPGRYFLLDTSKTITITGTQPTLIYGTYTRAGNNYLVSPLEMWNKEKYIASFGGDTELGEKNWEALGLGINDLSWYERNNNAALFAVWDYNPMIKVNVSYPGFNEDLYVKEFQLNGETKYGFYLPNPKGAEATKTNDVKYDGEYIVDKTQVLITSTLNTELYVGYPLFSDKQLLQRNGNDDDFTAPPANASRIRNVNWFPGIHLFWIDSNNANYQVACSEYWHQNKKQVLTDTTFEMKDGDDSKYLHRMLIPYPGTFTVKGKGNEDEWTVIVSPPKNFYIGSTVLKQNDDTIEHLAKSYNYRPSRDQGNSHIRVLYLASTDYLIPAYYSALMHEHDWNIKATWLNQDIGLYKTGVYRDTPAKIPGEEEYISKDTGKVFYAFDERIIKQHDAELERYESKLPSFHPLYAEITLPTYDAPYMGGYGLQLLYHNRIDRKALIKSVLNQTVPNSMTAETYIETKLTQAQRDEVNKYEALLKNYLGYIDISNGTTVTIEGKKFQLSNIFKEFETKSDSDLLGARDPLDDRQFIPNSLYPYEKQANGFYYAKNMPAYMNNRLSSISNSYKYGYDVDPSDSSRLTMPVNPWASNKLEPRVEDGLNGFYYTNYRIKENANKLGTRAYSYDGTTDTFLTLDKKGNAKFSTKDVLGNTFQDSDTYHILSWWSNPNVTDDMYMAMKPNLKNVSLHKSGANSMTLDEPIVGGGSGNNSVGDTSSKSDQRYGRAISDSSEKKQTFRKYNKRFWSPFDNGSGLTNYDIQGYYSRAKATEANKAAAPYKALPAESHKIIVHPIYHYETKRLNKYQHDLLLPADFSGELKLPSYITDIDTSVINTYEEHDARTYTGGYYTYTLYVAGQTGLIIQANHTGDFVVTPKKSQHLIIRQTSPWGSYAEYDLNLIYTTHIQKESSTAQLNKNSVDVQISIEDILNPYHQDRSVSYKLTDKEETLSAGEYMPQVITDLEADSPIYSQLLTVYMLYQDVPSYRYSDTGHMWMYDWFKRDGFHMNQFPSGFTLDTYKKLTGDDRYKDISIPGIQANEVVEGYKHDHVQTAGYSKLKDGGGVEWVSASYYDPESSTDYAKDFLGDGLLEYTNKLLYEQTTNDVQKLYSSYTNTAATPLVGKDSKQLTDTRARQNMRTFVRFIDALHNNDYSKYSLNPNDTKRKQLLRSKSYSYMGAYPKYIYNNPGTSNPTLISPLPDDKQLLPIVGGAGKSGAPWFYFESFAGENKLYQSTNMTQLLNLYRAGNRNPNFNTSTFASWSDNFGLNGAGPVGYPNRDWHHYYPDIPSTYEVPEGNITKDYMNMTQMLRESHSTTPGNISTWFGEALSDLLGRTIFTLPSNGSSDEGSQTSLDMFNYLNVRTSLHVRSYQDCINAVVFDSEAYNIMQSEIKPIIDLDNIQESDVDNDTGFWVKSLTDTFVNR